MQIATLPQTEKNTLSQTVTAMWLERETSCTKLKYLGKQCKHTMFELSWPHTICMLIWLLAAYYNTLQTVLVYSSVVVDDDLSLSAVRKV